MLDIKPIYNSGTITFVQTPEQVHLKNLETLVIKDPKGIIPNGIYKVFEYEKRRQIATMIFSFILIILQIILISLLVTVFSNYSWVWYIPLTLFLVIFGLKFVMTSLDFFSLKKSVTTYRENLLNDSRTTPPFISKLYLKLHFQQVNHNWITIFALFYGSIALLVFWWLKDASWWIFEFSKWINDLGPSPQTIGFITLSILIFILFVYIYLTIFRKKRIIDIQSFFGNEVISQLEIDKMVRERNKTFRRFFFLSILTILVLPIIIKIILKYVRKKGV
ncbi:MAG: MSC_0882 family membrane protein [Metamycoplasmataceae bacterium]